MPASRTVPTEAPSSVPASSIDCASLFIPFLPFSIAPFGYVSNVAKDQKHDAQRNSAAGAKSYE